MNNRDFNLIVCILTGIIILIFVLSSWESYLLYLNRKQAIESLKSSDSKFTMEQIQGLVNSTRK